MRISIHVPRVGDDNLPKVVADIAINISIHVPRVGDDGLVDSIKKTAIGNISIHVPRVGDDMTGVLIVTIGWYFYPRPPRGGRPSLLISFSSISSISIHVPRVGDDVLQHRVAVGRQGISIHVPRVGDDHRDLHGRGGRLISIHVPRVGDDVPVHPVGRRDLDFYPRPPRGGRPNDGQSLPRAVDFYPRPPRGGRPASSTVPPNLS